MSGSIFNAVGGALFGAARTAIGRSSLDPVERTIAGVGLTLAQQGVRFLVGNGIGAGLPGDFFATLQPASWRGIPFAVLGLRVRAGRRKALHEYPFRDGVWVEDLGKRGRLYGVQGFVVGDDAGAQIAALIAAAERAGPGELVHPTFGSAQCEVLEFEAGEEWDDGRVWRFRAEFLEPIARGLQLQPGAAQATQSQVTTKADNAENIVLGGLY